MRRLASSPRSKRLPCAARPSVSTASQQNPLCATQTSSSVGSVTTAPSVRTRVRTSRMPRLSVSSSATAQTTTSPRSVMPASRSSLRAARQAVTPPFMS